MTRADDWARVDYRSRAVAIICAIATTLVASVALRHAAKARRGARGGGGAS